MKLPRLYLKGLLVALFIFIIVPRANSFINIESLRQNNEEGFAGSTGLTLAGASGNVETFDTGLISQNMFRDHQREYILIGEYKYGEANDLKNDNQGSFHARYAQGFVSWAWWEVFTQVEFNEFQSLNLRKLLGGGLRARLFDSKKNSIFFGLGTFYEDEKIDGDKDQANFRGNSYLSLRSLLSESLETVMVIYYQPSYKTTRDYRVQATLGIESKLLSYLKLVNALKYSYDSRPPAGIENRDFTYKILFNFAY